MFCFVGWDICIHGHLSNRDRICHRMTSLAPSALIGFINSLCMSNSVFKESVKLKKTTNRGAISFTTRGISKKKKVQFNACMVGYKQWAMLRVQGCTMEQHLCWTPALVSVGGSGQGQTKLEIEQNLSASEVYDLAAPGPFTTSWST
jgi:hypothetical protein